MPKPEKMDAPEYQEQTDDTLVPPEEQPDEMEGFESFEKAA